MYRRFICIVAAVVALVGCEPTDQSAPTSIPDGVRAITEGMRGTTWDAPGGPWCRWWIVYKGKVTHAGNTTGPASRRKQRPGKAANQSQTLIVFSSLVGHTLRSDKCGGWTLR